MVEMRDNLPQVALSQIVLLQRWARGLLARKLARRLAREREHQRIAAKLKRVQAWLEVRIPRQEPVYHRVTGGKPSTCCNISLLLDAGRKLGRMCGKKNSHGKCTQANQFMRVHSCHFSELLEAFGARVSRHRDRSACCASVWMRRSFCAGLKSKSKHVGSLQSTTEPSASGEQQGWLT